MTELTEISRIEAEEIKMLEKSEKRENLLNVILKWIYKNMKFLLVPGYRLEELSKRELEYERTRSKRKFFRRLKSTLTILGVILVLLVLTFAVFGHWIAPYSYESQISGWFPNPYSPPSPEHPLGTINLGRDVLSRIIYGARSSLLISFPAITFSVVVGVFFGVVAGYFGGWIDSLIMRIMDILLAFPGLILALVFVAILGYRIENIMLALGILGVPYYSRLIRASVLQAKELPYVQSAKAIGAKKLRIMFKHILPNTIQPIIIAFTFDIGSAILTLAGLAYLGFSDPQYIEWGKDLWNSMTHIFDSPWAVFWPGLMIMITVLGFMLLGDGLRDALDPRLKNI